MPDPAPDPRPLTQRVWQDLQDRLRDTPSSAGLTAMLRYLAKWRSELLANRVVEETGHVVQSGPFKGMQYPVRAREGARAPRLLGTYESPLWPVIAGVIASNYTLAIDLGTADGYYAVGLARAMPGLRVLARDTDIVARALCERLAEANGLIDRIEVGGAWSHADFAVCTSARTVVLCDINGAEDDLLDPVRAPGLLAADILVEVHDGDHPGLVGRLTKRFAKTHDISRHDREIRDDALPAWADSFSDLDRMLILWEWRSRPTPWLWMQRRSGR
jgi:hypothetical protein